MSFKNKIFVLCNSDSLALPIIRELAQSESLAGVGLVNKPKQKRVLKPLVEELVESDKVYLISKPQFLKELKSALSASKADVVWVITFPWLIPSELLNFPKLGFYNFHFGLLPKYKGIDPVFWQIRMKEKEGGLTVHRMTEKVDEGPVILQEKLTIIPGETYAMHCNRLGEAAVTWIKSIIEIQNTTQQSFLELEVVEVIDQKPSTNDLSIDWNTESAEDIEWKVNAANPKYSGIRTSCNGRELKILEVTPVAMQEKREAQPGQIVYADSVYGIIVHCHGGECLRITMVKSTDGYLSGVKLFNLGMTEGQIFV